MSQSNVLRLFALITLTVATAAPADYDLSWHTVDGGGATAVGGGPYELGGTIGQPDAQVPPNMSGGAFELTGGFWPAANVCYCPGDMNGDGLKDGQDVQAFVACVIGGGNCSCADVNQANGVDLSDVPAFVAGLLAPSTCP